MPCPDGPRQRGQYLAASPPGSMICTTSAAARMRLGMADTTSAAPMRQRMRRAKQRIDNLPLHGAQVAGGPLERVKNASGFGLGASGYGHNLSMLLLKSE